MKCFLAIKNFCLSSKHIHTPNCNETCTKIKQFVHVKHWLSNHFHAFMCTRNVIQFYYNITRISVVISNVIHYQLKCSKEFFWFWLLKISFEKEKKWILKWNFLLFLVCWWPFLVLLSLAKLILLMFLSTLQQLLLFLLLRAWLIVSQVISWCKWRCPWWHCICLFLANFELQFLWFEVCISKFKKMSFAWNSCVIYFYLFKSEFLLQILFILMKLFLFWDNKFCASIWIYEIACAINNIQNSIS